jgi:hypothetical protein
MMNAAQALSISLWFLAVLAAAGVICGGIFIVMALKKEEWTMLTIAVPAVLISTGLLYLSLSPLGYPLTSLSCLRILSAALAIVTIAASITLLQRHNWKALWMFAEASLAGILFGLSMVSQPTLSVTPTPAVFQAASQSAVPFSETAALTLFALGTVVAVALFLWAVRRGDLPQIESHWGGLGGGMGGWRISASMAYLVTATIFGSLFAVATMKWTAETKNPSAPATEEGKKGSPTPAGERTSATPEHKPGAPPAPSATPASG